MRASIPMPWQTCFASAPTLFTYGGHCIREGNLHRQESIRRMFDQLGAVGACQHQLRQLGRGALGAGTACASA